MQGYPSEGGYIPQQHQPPPGSQVPLGQHPMQPQPQSMMGGLGQFGAGMGSPYQGAATPQQLPQQQQQQQIPMGPPAGDFTSGEQRMQEEIQSVNAMLNTLSHATKVFSEPPDGSSDHPTMDEVCQLYNLIVSLLQQDPNVHRLKLLLSNQGQELNVFSVLFDTLRANFMYAPGATSPNQVALEFNRLRVTALRTLAKVISLSSFDHYPSDPAVQQLSQLCARAVSASRGIETLLGIVCGGPQAGEEAKVAAVECLFVFAVRNSCGKQAVIDTPRSLHYFITALKTEESHMVRNYAAACIRELANTHPSHIIQCEFPEVVVDLVRTDSSADVRVLVIETLDLLLKADSSYLTRFPLKSELAEILGLLLDKDANKEVADISCRLLSTIFTTEGQQIALINHKDMPLNQLPVTFTTHWIEKEGYTVILEVIANSGQKVASMASIAFRHLVQYAPWQLQLGHKLIDHITTVGLLLNALKPGSAQPKSDDLEGQIPLVELSISLGLLFAQSPYTRAAIHRELCNYPALLPLLRSSIIANLNRPALQYYAKIDMIDITGTQLNSLLGVQWNESDGGPPIAKKASIRAIFQQQDSRVKESQPSRFEDRNIPVASTDYGDMDIQEQKVMRLTFVVLVYAICLGLSPGEPAGKPEQQQQQQPTPGGPNFESPQAGHVPQQPHPPPPAPGGLPTPTPTPTPGFHGQQVAPHTPPAGSYQQPPPQYGAPPQGAGYPPQQAPPGGFVPPAFEGMHPPPSSYPIPQPQDASRGLPQSLRQGTPSGVAQSQFTGYTRVEPPYGVPPQAVTPAPTRSSILREQQTHSGRLDRSLMRNAAPDRSFTPHSAMHSTHSMPPGVGGGSRMHEPMFPTAGPPTVNKSRDLEVSAELQQTYSKFDNALRLTIHFAQYFNRKVDKKPTYKATADGYVEVVDEVKLS